MEKKKIIGIDTGMTTGWFAYDQGTGKVEFGETTSIREVADFISSFLPDVIVLEEIVNYSTGIGKSVIRAAVDIGYFCRIGEEIVAENIMYTKASWLQTVFGRRSGITEKILRQTMLKNFNITKKVMAKDSKHWPCAAALVSAYLIKEKEK